METQQLDCRKNRKEQSWNSDKGAHFHGHDIEYRPARDMKTIVAGNKGQMTIGRMIQLVAKAVDQCSERVCPDRRIGSQESQRCQDDRGQPPEPGYLRTLLHGQAWTNEQEGVERKQQHTRDSQ